MDSDEEMADELSPLPSDQFIEPRKPSNLRSKYRTYSFLFSSPSSKPSAVESMTMRPYVIQRLLNQRARMKAPEPAPRTPPPAVYKEWEPDSDEYDTELEDEEEAEVKERLEAEQTRMDTGIGLKLYKTICAQTASAPQSSIMYNLASSEVKIPGRHMGAPNLTALMCALLSNTRLTHLDLSNNHLGFEGGREISTVLMANNCVTHLNLSCNGFGAIGISAFIAKMFRNNTILVDVNISDNAFTDEDAKYLAAGIEANDYIVKLNLSRNNICEDGATYMGKAIAANDTIEDLDLSWNSIRRKGAVTICKALKMNYSLKKLNLAWNGLYYEGALAVRDALSTNKHLLEIDISNNRINWDGALLLAEMLEKNCYLEVLRAGNNPLTTTGCLDIIDAVSGNENSGLTMLDLTDVPVIKEFVYECKRIQQDGRAMRVIHGEIVPHHDKLGERLDRKIHPMQKIINYMYEKEMRPLELLRSFDKEGNFVVTEDDFIERLKAKGIDIQSWERDELMEFINGQGFGSQKGMVNYKKLIESVTNQIDTERNHRITQREHGKAVKKLQDRIMQAGLPPLNVDAALVQITGWKAGDVEKDPQSVAYNCLNESLFDRRKGSFNSKMAMAKNIKLRTKIPHATPYLSSFDTQSPATEDIQQKQKVMKPCSKIFMTSPLCSVRARKTPTHKRSKSAMS